MRYVLESDHETAIFITPTARCSKHLLLLFHFKKILNINLPH